MSKYNIPNITGGFDTFIIGLNDTLPIFSIMFLIFVFGVVFLGGITSQKRRLGYVDVPMWATIASLSTLMISLPMTLSKGIIEIEILSLIVAMTIISGLWLFTSRNKNEV